MREKGPNKDEEGAILHDDHILLRVTRDKKRMSKRYDVLYAEGEFGLLKFGCKTKVEREMQHRQCRNIFARKWMV